ncbi:unspecific monooxygenase [Cooperia oncophora]
MHQLWYKLFIKKKNFVEAVRDWVEEYGPVHTFWFGPMATVNICDYSTAVDAMVKKGSAFASRNNPYLFALTRNGRGIIVTNGPPWLEQRRFALHTLRNFGLGRNIIEERIMYEFEIACERLDKRLATEGKSINAHKNFELLIGNVINRMLFTERFEKEEEEKFFALKKILDDMMEYFSLFDMLIEEWNVNWPFIRKRVDHVMKPTGRCARFHSMKQEIANGTHVLQGEGDDFVDAFLIQMKKERETGVPTSFDEEMLLMSLLDLWLAGQETTITTLEWAFSFLLLNPHVIARVEDELFSVTKGRRPLSIVDRPNTPYYNATIAFNPDRYFNGNKLEQRVVAFGLGKRSCLGESLAQAELYLIIANFLLRYKISADPLHMPSLKATNEMGTMRKPHPFHICFEHR